MRLLTVLLLPFAITACGSPTGNQPAEANRTAGNQAAVQALANGSTAAPAGPAMAGDVRLQAGQWELTALIRSIDAPGGSPEQQAAMRRQVGRPITNRVCMTEAQARDFGRFATRSNAAGCAMPERVYGAGVIRLRVSCPAPGGRPGNVRMTTQGRYTPTSLDLGMNQEVPGPGGGTMRMSATMSGRRIGPCPAGSAGLPPPRIRPPSNAVPVVVPTPPAR